VVSEKKIFECVYIQRSSPQKILGQLESNLVTIVPLDGHLSKLRLAGPGLIQQNNKLLEQDIILREQNKKKSRMALISHRSLLFLHFKNPILSRIEIVFISF
jgi:hypothetical protein